MQKNKIHRILIYLIASVWLVNGLVCKVLNIVPRHQQIVERIFGNDYSRPLTIVIGLLEIGMALWVVSGYKIKLNTIVQITVVTVMNIIEFFSVPDLLLWGKANLLFALLFVSIVYYNGFKLMNT